MSGSILVSKVPIFFKLMFFQTINLGCIIIHILSKFQWTLLLNYQLIYENMIYETIDVKFSTFISGLLPNLAKSSCEWSPVGLHKKKLGEKKKPVSKHCTAFNLHVRQTNNCQCKHFCSDSKEASNWHKGHSKMLFYKMMNHPQSGILFYFYFHFCDIKNLGFFFPKKIT
jgi:hypothetical protein